jgi:L-seryl-tRNA(Ser) seleniumtransferase
MPKAKSPRQKLLDSMPGMPALLNHPEIKTLRDTHAALYINDIVRKEMDSLRQYILDAPEEELADIKIEEEDIALKALDIARRAIEPSVKPAINAAGVILHTALGRAPLAEAAQKAVARALQGYCTLAINEETGRRGDRHLHLDRLIAHVTGAESGVIVNNNAAGTMLILNTLAAGREVIVSRGQLIEIGGAFRIPDVMERSGCKLVEVGTTNRTHLRDYENAITEETAAILRVHTSNYRIIGFTGEVPLPDLAALAHKHNLPVIDDLGSGALVDLSQWGLPREPTVQDSVRAGMDAICFSSDKMLGGPQGGYLIGKRDVIDRVKKNPLTRALRGDKMQYAAAEATLKLYLEPDKLPEMHPVVHMISEPLNTVKRRTQTFRKKLSPLLKDRAELSVVPDATEMGSGSLPGESISTYALKIVPIDRTADCIGEVLRKGRPPVFTRIADDAVMVDLRTVLRGEEKMLLDCIAVAFERAYK